VNVAELINTVNNITPFRLAFEDDKVGLVIGSMENDVSGILVVHDIEQSVLEHVVSNNLNTVISYHPVPMKESINETGEYVDELIGISLEFKKKNINVITLHTAQDVKINGNADELVDLFNMNDVKVFANSNEKYGAGRIGYIETIAPDKFLELVEKKLNTKIIRTNAYFKKIKEITKLAILPGSGTQFMDEIINEADVFLTGDISHRYFLLADDNKLGLVQINHISTEIPGMRTFKNKIANELNIKVEYFYNKNYE
tara:strand:- start:897 stop:1667 length:771 start_codon:yes stop_codon:yes gene_type:complete